MESCSGWPSKHPIFFYFFKSIVASLSAGVVCVLVAAFVPFHILEVTESAGILFGEFKTSLYLYNSTSCACRNHLGCSN